MAQAVRDRARRHVAPEDVAPPSHRRVRGDYGRTAEHVPPVNELEQQVGPLLPDVEVPELVDDEQAAVLVEPQPPGEGLLRVRVHEVTDELGAVGEVRLLVGEHGLVPQRDRRVALPDAGAPDEDHVVAGFQKRQRGELLYRPPRHAGLEPPVEVGEGRRRAAGAETCWPTRPCPWSGAPHCVELQV